MSAPLPDAKTSVPALAAHYADLLLRWADRIHRGTDLDSLAHELRYHAEHLQTLAQEHHDPHA